ncbi:MAG: PAS domain-containing protein, partial [Erysipelotrichaceae bacterium]|nr:PAS domain-containing protein [Erysipelotrichaceae bacterium]
RKHDYIVVSGMDKAIAALEDLKEGKIHNCFIEMSACEGSCVNGPAVRTKKSSPARNALLVNAYAGSEDFDYSMSETADIFTKYDRSPIHHRQPSEEEVEQMLIKMGKEDKADQLNCGCCGYDSCRDKAIAILKGYANIDMCLPLLMEKSQSLANNIVNNTPNGLIVLDEELNIGLINNTMCRLVGISSPDLLIGQHVASILDPSDFFDALEGKQIFVKNEYLKEYERNVVKTISYDRKFKVLVCVFRDVTSEEENKRYHQELVKNTISITDSLLEKNMRSVHEIASLLGETTAETKIALEKLKSLVKSDE